MGRGLGIFPARPKTPFVPGGATTRDKRPFCPGWWLHRGQKGDPLYMSLLPPPSSNTWAQFLICSTAVPERRRRPLLSPSAARAPPPPRPGRLGRRPRQAAHRCAAVLPPCHLVFAAPASTPPWNFLAAGVPPAALTTSLASHRDAEPARGDQKPGAVLQRPRPRALSIAAAGSRRRPSCIAASSTPGPR